MIGALGSLIGSMNAVGQAHHDAQQAQAQANAQQNAAYQNRYPEQIDAMRNALALDRYKAGNVAMGHMPFQRAKTFTDEAIKLMALEPDHREAIRTHAIECLQQFPDQEVARMFIDQMIHA